MTTTRMLVIGKSGQVAQAIAERVRGDETVDAAFFSRPELDLGNIDAIAPFLGNHVPDIVLNAGAYTSVDAAEAEPDLANAVNHLGPYEVAKWCAELDIPMLHMSTDCVFDGTKESGYVETDPPNPISVYGKTKADGEAAVVAVARKHLVVRVGWVHSRFGKTFPRTMLDLAKTHETVSVVCDQFGRPTHAADIAGGLVAMMKACLEPDFTDWGTYHLAGQGDVDRATMAEAIFEDSARFSGPTANVERVSSETFGAAAGRPLNARLNSPRAATVFGLHLPDWRGRLTDSVREIVGESWAK